MRRLRKGAQALTTAAGVSKCGRVRAQAFRGGPVEVRRAADGHAFFAGLLRCGSVWECPVCMERIQAGRALEVEKLGAAHRARGGELYLATLTIPHRYGHRLRELRERLNKAWRRVQAGRAWLELRRRIGLEAWVVAREVTVGPNGWHPHVHALLMTSRPLTPALELELLEHLRQRWEAEITRGKDWRIPSKYAGVVIKRAQRDSYVTKLAGELVRSGRKLGRNPDPDAGRHRTPLELLEDVVRAGRPEDIELWREYAAAMRGGAQLTYGGALRTLKGRAAWGLEAQTDLELAAAEEAAPALVLAVIEGELWDRELADRVGRQCRILEAAERLSEHEARDWIAKALQRLRGEEPAPF